MIESIVVCMAVHNNGFTLRAAIKSVLDQKSVKRNLKILISNDSSTDKSLQEIEAFLPDDRIILLNSSCGSASANRNLMNNYIREYIPSCILIGRLDADDELYHDMILSQIESRWEKEGFDILIMGNLQRKNGQINEWINRAEKLLLDDNYLLNRLEAMKDGVWEAELPSCNTFVSPKIHLNYPEVKSAEDHWFLVKLLLEFKNTAILVAEDLIYCIYSMDGAVTSNSKKENNYIQSRLELYQYAYNTINYGR